LSLSFEIVDSALADELRADAAAVGVAVDERLAAGLGRYLDLLLLWNRRVNLTAIRDARGIVGKHFVDSLALLPHIPASARSLVDVGSGAGFPGAVLALARPDLAVALIESIHKKAAFLEALRRELPLPNAKVLATRVEEAHVTADVAVSRATWELPEWLERGRTLVPPGGTILGMEAAERHALPPGARRHPYALAGVTRAVITFHVEP
jgi:16S rRNA (guanine527-N7)-methyltransferase